MYFTLELKYLFLSFHFRLKLIDATTVGITISFDDKIQLFQRDAQANTQLRPRSSSNAISTTKVVK